MKAIIVCVLLFCVFTVNCKKRRDKFTDKLTDKLKDSFKDVKDALKNEGDYIRDGLRKVADKEDKKVEKLVREIKSYHSCKSGVPDVLVDATHTVIEHYKNFTRDLKLRDKEYLQLIGDLLANGDQSEANNVVDQTEVNNVVEQSDVTPLM